MKRIPLFSVLFLITSACVPLRADTVIQIPLASTLTTRSVTTLTDGKLVTWLIGIDGGGGGNGYLTTAASLFVGDKAPHALPDSGIIAANARHPEIVLNYSNANGTGNQTRPVNGAGDFTFAVPQAKYSKLFLYFTSAEGASSLTFTLTYADSSATVNVELPDYYNDLSATDPVLFYVVKDLAKWSKANKMTEATHHNIDGVELHPAPGKILTGVKVAKTLKGYLVFWGATGIATTPVSLRLPPGDARTGAGTGAIRTLKVTGMGGAGPVLSGTGLEAFSAAGRRQGAAHVSVPPRK
ncbi:MAG: hypothetical protein JWP91_1798 [Fibrobacteres bacterium]|nr:hypothetical protein [Fibrobacterota bacterium]